MKFNRQMALIRIEVLKARKGKDNKSIIRKIERQLRKNEK